MDESHNIKLALETLKLVINFRDWVLYDSPIWKVNLDSDCYFVCAGDEESALDTVIDSLEKESIERYCYTKKEFQDNAKMINDLYTFVGNNCYPLRKEITVNFQRIDVDNEEPTVLR